LRGHDESSDFANPGGFRGLLEFAGKLDENLKSHFETATMLKGNSKTIQNELLDCILEVCRSKIAAEIGRANFLAVTSGDTTDVSEKTQKVDVFRYENGGTVHERFYCLSMGKHGKLVTGENLRTHRKTYPSITLSQIPHGLTQC
jgi:hypothetical protein